VSTSWRGENAKRRTRHRQPTTAPKGKFPKIGGVSEVMADGTEVEKKRRTFDIRGKGRELVNVPETHCRS